MSADPIVYCLEHLTDYRQFERLCSDVMSQSGYPDIEPLGGSSDRGRDALHISRANPGDVTIFAYSVRADWQRKLDEDCERIRDENHVLNRIAFACTASATASQRDLSKQKVLAEFGWDLELHDLERMRVRLAGELWHIVAQHPAIFCPPFFPTRGGLSITESRDTLVIDHVRGDHALGTWLSRRLQLAGYRTWCFGTAPLAGETADDTIRILIDRRATRYLPILSAASVADADFLGRCGLACGIEQLTIPCRAGAYDQTGLPAKLRKSTAVAFTDGWSKGLSQILEAFDSAAIGPSLRESQGKAIAIRSYVPESVTRSKPETVYTNTFAVTVPPSIIVCELRRPLTDEEEDGLRTSWAFVRASARKVLAFDDPPDTVPLEPSPRLEEFSWRDFVRRYERYSVDIVKELVRRSMDIVCAHAGMRWCDDRRVFYFAQDTNPHHNVPFVHVDGRKTRVTLTGEKTYGSGDSTEPFRYQLCPRFRVGFDENDLCWLTCRIYIRITDRDGTPHEKKAIIRRRKTVAKSWWNKEWFARTLGIMQALSGGAKEISIGSSKRRVVVSCQPMEWQCPVSIDYLAVERLGDFQEEMAQLRYRDDAEDESDDDIVRSEAVNAGVDVKDE